MQCLPKWRTACRVYRRKLSWKGASIVEVMLAVKNSGDCVITARSRLRRYRLYAALSLLSFAFGCATPSGKEPSPVFPSTPRAAPIGGIDAVLYEFKQVAAAGVKPRVAVISAALSSRSRAFEGDVRLFSQTVSGLNAVAPQIALNNAATLTNPYEAASKQNLRAALEALAQTVDPQGLAIVLLSSHGGVSLLEVNSRGQDLSPLSSFELRTWLEPLGKTKTLIIVSACHSGSFIRTLAASNRIILTAARADRSSFGCNFASGNTYFIEEMLKVNYSPLASINDLFLQTKSTVAARELRMRLSPPSEPQAFIGIDMQADAGKPLQELFKP